ncbi:transcriptional regulator with XRE-family HTH domain [Cerasibacillus quisquiliarum]|nr:helix-turn-helix domain-containing protein [Cerasibacillus quisquiliarum]MBB5144829.1 transcriptional regulator with XRE-family HTH domain [Cerasibacillus quisquiliarum]
MEAKDFGLYIRKLRKERNMTIRQLELYSGVSNSYLSQMENGKRGIPSPEIIKKLSNGLNVDYNELMKRAGYLEETESEQQEFENFIKDPELKRWVKELPKSKEEDLARLKKIWEFIKEETDNK